MAAEQDDEIMIAIMGPTGTGKSSFIRLVTGNDKVVVSDSLESQTSEVTVFDYRRPDGRRMILIDTPGFDDSRDDMTDADILGMIGAFLKEEYDNKRCLNGLVYMYNISNTRMGGIDRRNLKLFQQLVGKDTLCNVVVATTMWHAVPDKTIGERRQNELGSKDTMFKPLIDAGARIFPHDSGIESAQNIVAIILGHDHSPQPLLIQKELSKPGNRLIDTSAGAQLVAEFKQLDDRDKKKLKKLEEDLKEARKIGDHTEVMELIRERDKLMLNIKNRRRDRGLLERNADELGLVYGIRAGYRVLGVPGAIIGAVASIIGSQFLSKGKEIEERIGTSQDKSVTRRVAQFAADTEGLVEDLAKEGEKLIGGQTGAIVGGLMGATLGTIGCVGAGYFHVRECRQEATLSSPHL
ncbi:hypothetical protein GALMADRAFT_259681 [Galerina marginata CBS 339.88]|uniref:G domain-containing protein n=1 Tax=Galerina marginata (strain CBS 339.88) TaxID=685588 RepID=A0A067S8E2_GALM3|nr:hypothetical protein GALMADRAFT_259681 [Galerina marginata CBS 339.88]